ncbi:MAG: NAD/NADP octopine/nopaline dehydrogenase family protein, partial [Fidelibacterota bacterium]
EALIKQHPKLTDHRIPCPPSLNHRYLTENIPFALIPFLVLAAELQIPTPHIRSVIDGASQKLQRDFYATGAGKRELGIENVHLGEWLSRIK